MAPEATTRTVLTALLVDIATSAHGTDGELEDAKTTTNLGLVVAAGCVHAVKRVDISVYFKANPIPGLSAVVQLMRTAAERWEGVGRLSIAVHPDGRAFDEDSIGAAEHEDDTKPICAALAATMPAVRSLDLGGYSNNNPISWTLYGRLAVLYSDQLQGIDAGCPVVVPLGCTLEQLRAVSIAYRGEIGHPRTRMDLTSIASLTLESWPPNHPWTLFGPDNGSGAIVFSGLKALDILYDDSDTWDDNVLHLNEPDSVQEDVSVPEPGNACLAEPFDTKLKKMDVPEGPIMGFVKAYSAQYPHLAAIVFRFRDNGK
ncbi:hypothetical protein H4R18_003966 [Coemansia javaensis]|uniref:Uncharacterized protein n=1 Tax=Coemansia javaensis TaxID=2761396 RepID=A0A9W8HAF2_9FUNG|nr:hypothetical protein H4R18_003966 [Coemansia javaensis]